MAEQQSNMTLIVFITFVATIGGFLFGFDSGVINGTVEGLQLAFESDSAGTGFNVASMLLGCALGAFVAGKAADRWGRRCLLQASAILFVVSAWGSGIADSSAVFVVFRVIGGIAVGAASVITPAYISEIAPAAYRGRLASIQQIAIIIGLFVAFISNYGLANYAGHSTASFWLDFEAWRWMFWVELIPATLFFVTLFFIPESPRYLVAQNRENDAKMVLERLFNDSAESQLQTIVGSLNHDKPQSIVSFTTLLDNGKLSRVVWIGLGLAVFQQLVGINVVFYYGAVLWQAVGFNEAHALLINIISGGVSIGACLLTLYFIDKWGRKPFLLVGSIGMTLCLGLLVILFSQANMTDQGQLALGDSGVYALVAANAYVFFFNMSWGPVMWVMLGEMFPNVMRGSALSVAGLAQWGSNFLITVSFPMFLTYLGLSSAYGLYFISALVSIAFVLYCVKETKGKSLESMSH